MEDTMLNGLKQVTDIQDMETQASPSLLSIRQSDLKIIIDDFPEDQMKPSVSVKALGNINYITKMVDRIKGLVKKKKVHGNISEYNTCHSCRGLLERNLLICCSQPDCKRYFCYRCLNKKFSKSTKMIYDITISPIWNCVSCQGLCNCKICKDRFFGKRQEFPSELTRFEKSKKKQPEFHLKVENDPSDYGIKKEFVEDMVPIQVVQMMSPGYSYQDDKKSHSEAIKGHEDASSVINPFTSKARSKAIAKRMRGKKMPDQNDSDSMEEDTTSEATKKENIQEEQKIQNIKIQNTRGSKPRIKQMCHMCNKMVVDLDLATCSIEGCSKHYCITCINQIYQKDFDLAINYNTDCWICYSCGGGCECSKCKRRRTAGRKNKEILGIQEEMMTMQQSKKNQKLLEKRRMRFYDTLSEEEEEENQKLQLAQEMFKASVLDEEFQEAARKQVKVDPHVIKENLYGNDSEELKTLSTKEEIKQSEEAPIVEKGKEEEENPCSKEEEEEEEETKDKSVNKFLLKKKRLGKSALLDKEDIDNSKIISEVSIDYACITLYDAENEEELKKDAQTNSEI